MPTRSRTVRTYAPLLLVAALVVMAPLARAAVESAPDEATTDRDAVRVLTSPPRILASVAPGSSSAAELIVENQSRRPVPLVVETLDLAPDPDGESRGETVAAGEARRGAGEWLTVDRPAFTLGAGERRTLKVAIDVPDDASAGGHYGAIAVTTDPDGASDDAVGFRIRLVTHVDVLVPGDVEYDARVASMRARHHPTGSIDVDIEVENTGNIQTGPHEARLTIDGRFGRRRVDVDVPEILPGGTRHVHERVTIPSLLDRYETHFAMQIEDDQRVRSSTGPTWAWRRSAPWIAAGSILALLVIAVGVAWRRRRAFRRLVEDELERMEHDESASPDDPGIPH